MVAPIIATLLLVSIAVVGGITAFVWTGGIFSTMAGTQLPTVDSLRLIGYDARDVADLTSFSTLDIDNGTNAPSKLAAGSEYIVLKVRNTGNAEVMINKVTIIGQDHTWDSSADHDTVLAAGKFHVYPKLSGDITSATNKATASIAPGEDARVVVALSGTLPDDIGLNRNLQAKIKTEQGTLFHFFIVTGVAD